MSENCEYYFKSEKYIILYEENITKLDKKEILKKITSIKKNNIELIKKICLSMKNNEETYNIFLNGLFSKLNIGLDQHIISRSLIRGWNIDKEKNCSNILVIKKDSYKKINERVKGYSNVLSDHLYFVSFDLDCITALENGFISHLDQIGAFINNNLSDLDNKLENSSTGIFQIYKQTTLYNDLFFLYFFHWSISPAKNKVVDFINNFSSINNEIDFSNYETIISTLLRFFSDQINEYIQYNHEIAIVKINKDFNVETPLGKLFSVNLFFKDSKDNSGYLSISPINPYYFLVITNKLADIQKILKNKEDFNNVIKKYILHNIMDFYFSGKIEFVYKTKIVKNLINEVLNTNILVLEKSLNINFPLKYHSKTLMELIECNDLDIHDIKSLNLTYDSIKNKSLC